jgi:hypothetical protein
MKKNTKLAITLIFLAMLSLPIVFSTPSEVIIEKGSARETADYITFREADGLYYAKNGSSGEIHFQSDDATVVIQSVINAINESNRQGGTLYLARSHYFETYQIPNRGYSLIFDYDINNTIQVPDGISIISDGALIKATDLNKTIFELNSEAKGVNSNHWNWVVSGLAFIGHSNNTNTTAIHLYDWPWLTVIDNIHTEHVANPVKIEGEAYRTVVQNSYFGSGDGHRNQIIGIHVFQGRGAFPPHAVTIVNNDISLCEEAIRVEDNTYGTKISNNYFEGNNVSINLTGAGYQMVTSNYFQPGRNSIGIYAENSPTIVSNSFLQGSGSAGSVAIYHNNNDGQIVVDGNRAYLDADPTTFFYSPNTAAVQATIVGNSVTLDWNSDSKFIDANLGGSIVSGNFIRNGLPAIHQRVATTDAGNLFTGNSFFNANISINTTG